MAFENEDVPAFQDEQKLLYPLVEKAVLDCLVKACKKVDGCAVLEKLKECIQALEFSQRFDCNTRLPSNRTPPSFSTLGKLAQASQCLACSSLGGKHTWNPGQSLRRS